MPTRKEIHAMVSQSVEQVVKPMVQELFTNTMRKQDKKRSRREMIYDSDSDEDQFGVEQVSAELVSHEVMALSALREPPRKRQKTNHLLPVTVGLVNTRLGKVRLDKCRILFDSGSSGSIIVEKFVRKLRLKSDMKTTWETKGGTFHTTKRCKTSFVLPEFFRNRAIDWDLHVDSTSGPHRYDMILGRDVMSELGLNLNFGEMTMTWDDSTISMKEQESLSDILNPVNDFYWYEDLGETEALQEASTRLKNILDAKYKPADLDEVVRTCEHLDRDEQCLLHALLTKYEHLFDGTLGTWNNEPYDIELKEGATPYHARPFPIPKVHEHTLKVELERLAKIGVLK
jgi:hypothetical protein